ncbi:MAG: flagellar hook-associated protein FlgK [Thermoleophilia bacterium]|nr:flagellar hook-associated protein FlgK [Thermoleophilia bacterium]
MYQSTFMGLNTALRGVLAQQVALDTTGHNISNLSTEGYTRQRAEMTASAPWSNPSAFTQTTPGQIGTGVEVLRIERLRDQFIDQNARGQFGRQADAQATVEQLHQVEAALQEPGDTGLSKLFANFWSSMDAVASNADNDSARQAFANATSALAQGFRQVSTDLGNVAMQSDLRLNQTVTDVNGITQRIAALNTEIHRAIDHSQQPNDLLDERDKLMDDLSKLVNYTSTENAFGEVTITFGSAAPIALVDPTVAPGSTAITRADLDTAFGNGDLTSGRAHADEQLWDPTTGTIPGYIGKLDALVADFVSGVNTAHAAGFDLNGNPGGNIFNPAGTTAATISLDPANNIVTNPRLVAAASSWTGTGEPGNGTNLKTVLDTVRPGGNAALGGQTWDSFYKSTVTTIGADAQTAESTLTNADVLSDMAKSRRDQVSGVSMDEEMSNMLRFQHAYNASARVLTTMDELLDTLINRMGRVGL